MEPNRPSKSSSSECTYAEDLTDVVQMRGEIAEMAGHNARWLRKRGLLARTVTIKVRYDDFSTITRSHSTAPTDNEADIVRRAVALLEKTDAQTRPVRLLGAGVHNLVSVEELTGTGVLPFDDGSQEE